MRRTAASSTTTFRLRDAIALAPAGETINFAVTGTINLSSLGQLVINKNLTITGPGANLLTINAFDPTPTTDNGDGSRVFNINDGTAINLNISIRGVTLTGGDSAAGGGGIHNENEIVILTACTVSGNAGMQGGGLFNNLGGEMTLVDSTISGNVAVEDGGGIYSNHGRVTLTRSVATDNSAGRDGGAAFAYYGDLIVSDSTITGNTAGGDGGGLYSSFGNFTVTHSTISGNDAGYGGGIYNYSNATVTTSTIDGNSAEESGGGVHTRGNLTLSESTISGNSATFGGGIYSYTDPLGPTTTVVGSTISGNTATELGGGFYNYFGVSLIRHSTITNNTAPIGGGGGVASYAGSNMRTEVHSTIIAGNNGSDVDFVAGAVNSFQSSGYNLIGQGNAVSEFVEPGDQTGVSDPMLDPLANNGGPTRTHAVLAGSPAIDAGDPAAVAGLGTVPMNDQRDVPFTRVFDGNSNSVARIDIGAYELQPKSILGDYNLNGTVDAADYVMWRKTLSASVAPPFTGADGDGDSTIDPDDHGCVADAFWAGWPPPGSGAGEASSVQIQELRADAQAVRNIAADYLGESVVQIPTETISAPAKTDAVAARATSFAVLETRSPGHDSSSRSRRTIHRYQVAESGGDDLPLLLAIDRVGRSPRQDSFVNDDSGNGEHRADDDDSESEIDEPLAVALAVRRGARSTCILLRLITAAGVV